MEDQTHFQSPPRDLLGLMVVAAVSSLMGATIAPDEPAKELLMAGVMLLFGVSCYLAGIFVGKSN